MGKLNKCILKASVDTIMCWIQYYAGNSNLLDYCILNIYSFYFSCIKNWMKNKILYTFHICKISKLLSCIKIIWQIFYGPSINHKDGSFCQKKKLHWNWMKNKKVQILALSYCLPFLVELPDALATINSKKKSASKWDEKILNFCQIHKIGEFGALFDPLFEIK